MKFLFWGKCKTEILTRGKIYFLQKEIQIQLGVEMMSSMRWEFVVSCNVWVLSVINKMWPKYYSKVLQRRCQDHFSSWNLAKRNLFLLHTSSRGENVQNSDENMSKNEHHPIKKVSPFKSPNAHLQNLFSNHYFCTRQWWFRVDKGIFFVFWCTTVLLKMIFSKRIQGVKIEKF